MNIERSSDGKNWISTSEDWLERIINRHNVEIDGKKVTIKKYINMIKKARKGKVFKPLGDLGVKIRRN